MGTPRRWCPGWAFPPVTYDVGGSHMHLIIVLLALSGPGHLRLILNLAGKGGSLRLAGAGPLVPATPHPACPAVHSGHCDPDLG